MTDNKHEHGEEQLGNSSHRVHLDDIAIESIHGGTVQRRALIRPGEVGEVATMNFAWLEPGQSLEEHDHPDCIEYYLFLEGDGMMRVAEENMGVSNGDFVTVKPTEPHSLKAGDETALSFVTMRAFEKPE